MLDPSSFPEYQAVATQGSTHLTVTSQRGGHRPTSARDAPFVRRTPACPAGDCATHHTRQHLSRARRAAQRSATWPAALSQSLLIMMSFYWRSSLPAPRHRRIAVAVFNNSMVRLVPTTDSTRILVAVRCNGGVIRLITATAYAGFS